MASVAWGSKLVVRCGDLSVVMRSLRSADLGTPGWAIPVMADVDRLVAAGLTEGRAVTLEVTTDQGPSRLDVEIVVTEGDLMLRAPRRQPARPVRAAALTDQRRENVRGAVGLEFRGTLMGHAGTSLRPSVSRQSRQKGLLAAMGPGEGAQAHLVGVTTSISAGGVCVELEQEVPLAPGDSVYGELTLPGGDLVPAILLVLQKTADGFRGEFTDISPLDTERLVRLVFHRDRGELAGRR